jgi:hypothetical protein
MLHNPSPSGKTRILNRAGRCMRTLTFLSLTGRRDRADWLLIKPPNRDEVPHLPVLGAGVTPAEGSVKPTAGFTFNQAIYPSPPAGLSISARLR